MVKDVSQAISHVLFNSNIILKSFQKFHIIFHRDELCSINLLKSVFASHDISRGVSHPKKIHVVFTWTSHSSHRVAPSICMSRHKGRVKAVEGDFTV